MSTRLMWDRQQHSLSRNNRKYFAEYLTWQTFCQCPALFTNGSDMWKVVSTLVLFFSHIRILNNHVLCACMCLSTHFLHVCRNLEFVFRVFRACLWPRSTLWWGSKCICWIFSSSRKHWGTRLLFAGCSRCRWAILLKWSPLPRFRLELASAAVTI